MTRSKKAKKSVAATVHERPEIDVAHVSRASRLLHHAGLQTLVVFGTLCIVGFFTYRESLAGRLFFDDISAIEHNGHVFALVDPQTRWHWGTWRYAATANQDSPFAGRPVVALSFALNHWWASAMRPSGMEGFTGVLEVHYPYFHWVNLALHIAIALTLYSLLRRTLLTPVFASRFAATAPIWASAVALIWLVHPLNTETVVYVTQRTEQVVSLFLLLTLLCGTLALDAGSRLGRIAWQALAVAACALGMASKENMIAAPLLAIAYDRALRFDTWAETLRHRAGYYACLAATWLVLLAIMMSAPRGRSVGFDHEQLPWYDYLLTQCWCLWRYFWLSVMPLGSKLCVDYGSKAVLEFWHVAPGALLVLSALGLTLWGWLHRPWIGFLGTWFFFILAPTSSFVPIVTEVGAERRMYLPLVAILCGAAAVLAAAIGELFPVPKQGRQAGEQRAAPSAIVSLAGFGLFIALASWFGRTSHDRTKIYQDDLTLYGHIVAVFPDNDRGQNNLASRLIDRGMLDAALGHLNRAITLDPQYTDAYSNRALVYLRSEHHRRLDAAVADATTALVWHSRSDRSLLNRGDAFTEAKQFDDALADYTRVIDLTGGRSDAFLSRAEAYTKRGEIDVRFYGPALTDIDQALVRNPYSINAYLKRASILNLLQLPDKSLPSLEASLANFIREASRLSLDPRTAPGWDAAQQVLSSVNAQRRQLPPAAQSALRGFRFRSVLADILVVRAQAYLLDAELNNKPRERRKALDDLSRAVVLEPNNAENRCDRGRIYLSASQFGEALLDFDQALAVDPHWVPALRGRVECALKTGNYAGAWLDAKQLRDLGKPLDAPTLAELRKRSGLDYP